MVRLLLKSIFLFASSVIGLLLLFAFLILLKPDLLLNERNLDRLAHYLREKQILDIHWTSMRVEAHSQNFWTKEIRLAFKNLCFKSPQLDFCAGDTSIRAVGDIRGKLAEVGPIAIHGVRLNLNLRGSNPQAPLVNSPSPMEASTSYLPEFPSWLKEATLHQIDLSAEFVTIFLAEEKISGSADVRMWKKDQETRILVRADASVPLGKSSGRQSSPQFSLELLASGGDLIANSAANWKLDGNLRTQRWRLREKPSPLWLTAAANVTAKGQGLRIDALTQFQSTWFETGKKPAQVSGRLAFSPSSAGQAFHHAQGSLSIRDWHLDDKTDLTTEVSLNAEQKGKGADLATAVDGTFRVKGAPPNRIKLKLQGSVDDFDQVNLAQATVSASAQNPPLEISDCRVNLEKRGGDGQGGFQLRCPGSIVIGMIQKKAPLLDLPDRISFGVESDLNIRGYPPTPSSQISGNLKAAIVPVQTGTIEARTSVSFDVKGVPSHFPRGWVIDEDLDIRLRVKSFEKVVRRLVLTPWAIPAPFSVLRGTVSLDITGDSDAAGKFTMPIAFNTRLKSQNQVMNLDGNGVLIAEPLIATPKVKLDFDLLLNDVQLEMIRLNLGEPPRFTPDNRIKSSAKIAAAALGKSQTPPLAFAYSAKVRSAKPVRILSNLAKAPIPIQVNLILSDQAPLGGDIQVQSVPLELFRRTATLSHFNVHLRDPSEESKIDGAIRIAYVDYTITLLLINTLGKPTVKMLSDPPLPEDQVLATLLFGQPMDALDADQSESVGDTKAALTDSAIGLASLYALASTPIQRVGYNPVTKVFTAKVRIAEGTSVEIGGTKERIEEVGVRKRLTSKWSIRTDLQRASEMQKDSVVSTFLEWVHRY